MFTNPRNSPFSAYSSSYQMKIEKALIDFDSHQEKRLSSLRTQLGQQQDDMISNINLLWKAISESLMTLPFVTLQETPTTEYEDHEMNVESEEEFGEETKDEIEKEEEDSPKHFDTFPAMKELRLHYNWIMSKRLGPRRKPSNLGKICNFVERVKELKVFVENFTYECDFMVLEDTTSVFDHDLGLYLTRRSLEVLRKFHWTILGGRFNQLSHVSSPLLSKPGEY
ncbi:hypothetical protein Tco_0073578 [Tanacetum coccineum]